MELTYEEMERRYGAALGLFIDCEGKILAQCRFGSPPFMLMQDGFALSTMKPDFEPKCAGTPVRLFIQLGTGDKDGPYNVTSPSPVVENTPFIPPQIRIPIKVTTVPQEVVEQVRERAMNGVQGILSKVKVKGAAVVRRAGTKEVEIDEER